MMSSKKRWATALLTVVMALCCTFGLTGVLPDPIQANPSSERFTKFYTKSTNEGPCENSIEVKIGLKTSDF